MNLKNGKTYTLRFRAGTAILTYRGTIVDVDDNNFVCFIDKYGKEITFNLALLISFEEVENGTNE